MPKKEKKDRKSEWEPEVALDLAATLEDLINEPPFKEASDEVGQSTTAGTRIPLWLKRRIIKLRELSGSPYELDSDVTRDALFLGLRVLHLRYKMTPDWEVETKLAAAVDATSAGRRVKRQVSDLIVGLDEMFKDGDIDKATHNLSEYILAAAGLESEWHKEKVFKLLGDSRVIKEIVEQCSSEIQQILKRGGK